MSHEGRTPEGDCRATLVAPAPETHHKARRGGGAEKGDGDTTFLGEEYAWDGNERKVRNSVKTIAKLELTLSMKERSNRSYVAAVSLMMYALHTTRLNPSMAFYALRVYRAVYSKIHQAEDWDERLRELVPLARESFEGTIRALLSNPWYTIPAPARPTYMDEDYDLIVYTDACYEGWGAIIQERGGEPYTLRQKWVNEVGEQAYPRRSLTSATKSLDHAGASKEKFQARHSAHSEPRAVWTLLKYLGLSKDARPMKIAIATDHQAIVEAQRKENGFGGIGRGFELEGLYNLVNELFHTHDVKITFFYVRGELNPADPISRDFTGVKDGNIVRRPTDARLPSLRNTYCPLCEEQQCEGFCGDKVPSHKL